MPAKPVKVWPLLLLDLDGALWTVLLAAETLGAGLRIRHYGLLLLFVNCETCAWAHVNTSSTASALLRVNDRWHSKHPST
jgi:hypothetical protein